jgi:hypothetical protein
MTAGITVAVPLSPVLTYNNAASRACNEAREYSSEAEGYHKQIYCREQIIGE